MCQQITSPMIPAETSATRVAPKITRASRSCFHGWQRGNKIRPNKFVIMVAFPRELGVYFLVAWFSAKSGGVPGVNQSVGVALLRGWPLSMKRWNLSKESWQESLPAQKRWHPHQHRSRAGRPTSEAPKFFAGNQSGSLIANGSAPLKQRKPDAELDSAWRTFYMFDVHVNFQMPGQFCSG